MTIIAQQIPVFAVFFVYNCCWIYNLTLHDVRNKKVFFVQAVWTRLQKTQIVLIGQLVQ